MGERGGYWSVTVSLDGEEVVTIEPNMLGGRDIGPAEEQAIRTSCQHLLSFIGESAIIDDVKEGR